MFGKRLRLAGQTTYGRDQDRQRAQQACAGCDTHVTRRVVVNRQNIKRWCDPQRHQGAAGRLRRESVHRPRTGKGCPVMARKPIEVERVGLLTPRERIWEGIRQLRRQFTA